MDKDKLNEMKKNVLSYLRDLIMLLSIILLLFLLVFRIVVVSGPSMVSTLENGDYLIVINQFLLGDPEPGDIVVISKSAYEDGTPIIKRVIATEGQQVTIQDGKVFVDGTELVEPYVHGLPTYTSTGDPYTVTVDPGCIFVLGDNRVLSKDSRSSQIGQIDRREILGTAWICFLPGANALGQRDYGRIGGLE